MADSEDWIKQRAYELWEADGQQHGKHDDHWKQATEEYEARTKGGNKAPGKRKATTKPDALAAEKAPAKASKAKAQAEKPQQAEPGTAKTAPSKAATAKAAAGTATPKRARKSQPA